MPNVRVCRGDLAVSIAAAAAMFVLLRPAAVEAQISGDERPFAATVEGFANLTGGVVDGLKGPRPEHALRGRADIALRTYLRIEAPGGFSFGPRVVVQSVGQGPVGVGDRSLVLSTPWGRLELGYRQGLPDTLVGYAPNSYTFTGVEFGPPSGLNLFPHGGLQTALLAPAVATAVASLSYLGIATAFAGDFSPKLIYVSPRFFGLQLGLAGTTNADPTPFGADYASSAQAGIVHERYFGQNVLRIGGSYGFGHQTLSDGAGGRFPRDLHSGNAGITLVVNDEWIVGASGSLDYARRTLMLDDPSSSIGYGFTASVNRESGPWDAGGFVQQAHRRDGSVSRNELYAAEIGASYRLETRLRLYTAVYAFTLSENDGIASLLPRARGGVFLLGVRGQL